jgi:hypothetical protein
MPARWLRGLKDSLEVGAARAPRRRARGVRCILPGSVDWVAGLIGV